MKVVTQQDGQIKDAWSGHVLCMEGNKIPLRSS
jgi:hypothetical protein